jgi:hypothetical protein
MSTVLEKMIREKLSAACDQVTPEKNIEFVCGIAKETGCTIVSIQSGHDLARYTCLVYALNFVEHPAYLRIAMLPQHDVFAGKKFAQWLVNSGALEEILSSNVPAGTMAIYFDHAGVFTHIGITIEHERVRSKWGTLGLFEHDLFDVPLNYGNTVRFFKTIAFDNAIELFYTYAQLQGVNVHVK